MSGPSPRGRWGARLRGRAVPAAARLIDRLAGPLDGLAGLMAEQINAGILIVDRRGAIVRVNEALRRLSGGSAQAAPGRPAMQLFLADERAALWRRLLPALLGQAPDSGVIATLEQAQGNGLAVEISAAAVREADGAISGLILRLTDISVQRRLEAELAQSQKLQAVGQLAAGIAHDFNNLLTAVIGAADMITGRPGLDAETREDAAQIRGSAERGGNLVRQLLAFGRQQALLPRVICIDDAIRDLSGLLSRLLGSSVRLELRLESPERLARVDPTQLDQVLINLAVNARDAMPDGGTLTVRSGHITLHRPLVRGTEAIPPGRYVMIEVQDTGVGIEPEVLGRIFDPFFSTKRDRGGTGLGLSTVHGIVRQSDGFLGVESETGQGTRMRVYLPRHEAAQEIGIPPPPAVEPQPSLAGPMVAGARCVLLVDDEVLVRRLAERAFGQAGWTVLSADSGDTALALVGAQPPRLDLVISDVMMPGIDGPSLVTRLRRARPGLPALLVSGYADEALRRRLAEMAVGFLAKPYRTAELIGRAETLVAPTGGA